MAPEEKLEPARVGALALAGFEPAEAVPLLASLLSLRLPDRYPPLEISPELQRQKTLETLLAWVLALGEKQPVVLLVEDLHWADPSTLEWLGLLIEQCATAEVLLLLTYRPDFEPPWPARGHVLPIALSRLEPPPGEGAGRGGGARGAPRRGGRSARRALRRHPALRGGAGEGRCRVGPRSRQLALGRGDPGDAPGLADGAARSPRRGEAGGAARRRDRPRVSLCAARESWRR